MSEGSPFQPIDRRTALQVTAPDGSLVSVLTQTARVSTIIAALAPGQVATPVRHRTVDEVWYVLAGDGEIWRSSDGQESVTALQPGVSLTIPCGTGFQFRATAASGVEVLIATAPPWPGEDEAEAVAGPWPAA